MIDFYRKIALAIFAFCLVAQAQGKGKKLRKPNVVVLFVDDMGWTDLGCFGSKFYETPNIDALAEDGVRFTNAYANCTVCSPSRASMMTGKYPARLHLTDWIQGHSYLAKHSAKQVPDWTMKLDPKEKTVAEILKDEGYTTMHVGKWHLGEDETDWPEYHGFDHNVGGWSRGAPKGGYFSPYDNPRLKDGPKGEHLTDRLTDEAIKLIGENKEKPFFLHFAFYAVHTPLQGKKDLVEKYKRVAKPEMPQRHPIYAAMVEAMDQNVGRLVEYLKQNGLYENTLIVFTSDNGGLVNRYQLHRNPNHTPTTNNLGLRSGKGDMYEGSVRVPMFVTWKGEVPSGKTTDQVAMTMDVKPTVLDFLGLKKKYKPEFKAMDGQSLRKTLIKGKTDDDRPVFWHYPHYHYQGAVPYGAVRSGDWKLVEIYEDGTTELYNLANDLEETHDLSASNPEKTAELKVMLNDWRKEVKAQMPVDNPDFDPKKSNHLKYLELRK
ncbi:sulfatase [Fulvitalea axinellae]|uniref:Sulfatase n=1 Tax=Fulvitalea axinellae TaxID=1182444 RepID=A0AAU9CL71_9BACT|nr:sulfatase [Fulvitalea axinellae]